MASDARPQSDALAHALASAAASPESWDVFQLLRRIDALSPDSPRLGETSHPEQDALRIGQDPSMVFAPRPISRVALSADGPARLQTHAFGLFGPNGPLPLHLTEYAQMQGMHLRDFGFARFADMLQHRLATLFFRAWAEGEPTVSYDRPDDDRFGRQLGALAGYGMASLENRDNMPDLLKRHFTGRLASGTRNPEGLTAILSTYFDAEVEIDEFRPSLVALPPAARCRLGAGAATAALGRSATAGSHVRVHHHKFRIVIGPLSLPSYRRFLPGGPALRRLAPIVRNYVGDTLEWDLTPTLRAEDVPRAKLGQQGQLGWTSWVGKRRNPGPADNLVLGRATRERANQKSITNVPGQTPATHPKPEKEGA